MNKRIVFRGMEHSPTIEEQVNTRLVRTETFLENERDPVTIDVILEAHRTHHHHRVEIHVKSPNYDVIAHHEGPDMHDEINRVTETIYRELLNKKRERIDDRNHPNHGRNNRPN
jgi:ribosomal subunit interface protein